MSEPVLNRGQSRRIDQLAMERYGMSGLVLMENAGRGVADTLCRLGIRGAVAICCGKGNNGGDGFVIARHLDLRGFPVRVLLAQGAAPIQGDAAANLAILEHTSIPIIHLDKVGLSNVGELLTGTAWVVDALLGTGAKGEPAPPLDSLIDELNACGTPIMAVDVPSGLDCDTGAPAQHTIRAAHTCTFVAMKTGFLKPCARAFTGQVHVLDIGAPQQLLGDVLRDG